MTKYNETSTQRKRRLAKEKEKRQLKKQQESPKSRELPLARKRESERERRRNQSPQSRELRRGRHRETDRERRQKNRERRQRMTFAETKAFLKAYLARKTEFDDTKKRKNAMKHVLEDLIAQGILTDFTTVKQLEAQLRSLVRAYKTSRNPLSPHVDLIHEIVGGNPVISSSAVDQVDESMASTWSSSNQTNRIEASESSDEESTSGAESPSAGQPRQKIKLRQSAKEWYNDRKIILLKNYRQAKAKRHEAYLKEKEKFRRNRHIDMMQEIRHLIELMK